jgi:hypothetical protein
MADTKHLEFLQAAIARMAANSFFVKGWTVTLVTALVGVAVKESARDVALIGLIPVLFFAFLDAYYLALERGFRRRFEIATKSYVAGDPPNFEMSPDFTAGALFKVLGRPVILLTYSLLGIVLIATSLILGRAADPEGPREQVRFTRGRDSFASSVSTNPTRIGGLFNEDRYCHLG